jgi:Asp-tRNA(Asn)/Glu-tRNA(Gln) amidotransferase A subunit family amidase
MAELCDLSATQVRCLIGRKAISPVELLESCLDRIERVNPAVNAVVALDVNGSKAAAEAAELAVLRGDDLGPLHGLPVGIKDLEETAGLATTWGSPLFRDHVPSQDAGIVARVRAAGGIVLGKTNTPEFGLGGNTRNAVYGATGNPFNAEKSCAGSSGGSAVALATGMAPLCTGSDTAGSLRNPAAFCGVVGFRPSPGLVPSERRALGWTPVSVLGPMGRTTADVAMLLSAIASDDGRDPLAYTMHRDTIRGAPRLYSQVSHIDLATVRAAISEDFGIALVASIVRRAFQSRIDACRSFFREAVPAHPDCSGGDESFAVLRAAAVLAGHLDRYRNHPEQCGPNLKANVEEGLGYSLADQARAHATQTRIYRTFEDFFRTYDVLITPAITVSPRPWRELYPVEIDGERTRSYFHWLAMAYYVSLVGHPAVSLPVGLDEIGMPFGIQIIGPRGGDVLLLQIAAALEEAFSDHPSLRRPVPDIAALRRAPPISSMDGFLGWE